MNNGEILVGLTFQSMNVSNKSGEEVASDRMFQIQNISSEEFSQMEILPSEILNKIFKNLQLYERTRATQVCHRWRNILTDGTCDYTDVAVLNFFEARVWNTLSQSSDRIKAYAVSNRIQLREMLRHIGKVNSLKLWYFTKEFVVERMEDVVSCGVIANCIDMYPYDSQITLDQIHESFPKLENMIMRPHDSRYFRTGLYLPTFPAFSCLTSLTMENFNIDPVLPLPPTLVTFEFANRDGNQYLSMLPALRCLKKLKYFSLSHATINNYNRFDYFVETLLSLPELTFLALRYCRFDENKDNEENPHRIQPTTEYKKMMKLDMLKIDLCTGNVIQSLNAFIKINQKIKIFSLTVVIDLNTMKEIIETSEIMKKNKIYLHLNILQQGERPAYKSLDNIIMPASLASVLGKFEASFVTDPAMIKLMLNFDSLPFLQEMIFVRCSGFTEELLKDVITKAPLLRRANMITCESLTDFAIIPFMETMKKRISQTLKILWKARIESNLWPIVEKHGENIENCKVDRYTKTFEKDAKGEKIVIRDTNNNKQIVITSEIYPKCWNIEGFFQDYSDSECYSIIGVRLTERDIEDFEEIQQTKRLSPELLKHFGEAIKLGEKGTNSKPASSSGGSSR